MRHFEKYFLPFENYEKYTQEFGNTEARFHRAIQDLKIKEIVVEPPYNEQQHIKGYGTWYNVVGFRHIHAEMNWAYRNKGIPPELKNLDERYLGEHDIKFLRLYEQTKDISVLKDWYAK
jgi:hypothetical protein